MNRGVYDLIIEHFYFRWTSDTIEPSRLLELTLEESYECYEDEALGDYSIRLDEEESQHMVEVMKQYMEPNPYPTRQPIYYCLVGFMPRFNGSKSHDYISFFSQVPYEQLKEIATQALIEFNKNRRNGNRLT